MIADYKGTCQDNQDKPKQMQDDVGTEVTDVHDDKESLVKQEITYTINQVIEHCGIGKTQYIAFAIAGLALMANAITTMILSFILPVIQGTWNLSESLEVPLVGAANFIGAALGNIFWGYCADKWGRRTTVLVYSIAGSIMGVLSAFSTHWVIFTITRCLTGFAMAGIVVSWNILLEFLPTKHRGLIMQVFNLWWTAGIIFEVLLTWLLIPMNSIHIMFAEVISWRLLLFILGFSPLLVLLLYPIIPESPRYLLVANKRDEAEKVVQRVFAWNNKVPLTGKLCDVAHENIKEQGNYLLMFKNGFWKITIPIFGMWIVSSLVYYGVAVMTPLFFKSDAGHVYLEIFLCTLAELPGTVIGALALDRVGRRWTITILYAVAGVFLLLLILPGPNWMLLLFAMISRMCITSGYNSTMIFTPELFPTSIRTTSFGVAAALSQCASIVAMFVSTSLMVHSEIATIIVFGLAALVGAACCISVRSETANVDLVDHVMV